MLFLLILGLLGGWASGERHPLVPTDAAIRMRWSGATSGTNGWIIGQTWFMQGRFVGALLYKVWKAYGCESAILPREIIG